jgi:hypothetical protein
VTFLRRLLVNDAAKYGEEFRESMKRREIPGATFRRLRWFHR